MASSPQLHFHNAFAKLAGNVDLRLRGTVASPSLLGRVSITEGSAIIAGTRYDLQRGDVFFTNPVLCASSLPSTLTPRRVETADITLGIHGTHAKRSLLWHSDPPLPEADVVALLALGRTENQQRLYTQQQEQSVANPTTGITGGALKRNERPRARTLPGPGSVKVDPNFYWHAQQLHFAHHRGERVGKTLPSLTRPISTPPASSCAEAKVIINRHVSMLRAIGILLMVVKATRRYR